VANSASQFRTGRPLGVEHSSWGLVAGITPGSPADKAGLKRGDLIIAVNGTPIISAAQLRARVGLLRIGQTLELELLRNGERIKVSAAVAEPVQ